MLPYVFLRLAVLEFVFQIRNRDQRRITSDILTLYLLGLPALLVGLGIGFALYGKLDDLSFRKTVLVLLLLAGFILIVPIMN